MDFGHLESTRHPRSQWARCWCLTLVAVIVVGIALELLARSRGHRPLIRLTAESWALRRIEASEAPKTIAFVGASRMSHAIDLKEASLWRVGHRPVQLAVEGMSVLPVLEDLAEDGDVNGIVVVSVSPIMSEAPPMERAEIFVRHYRATKDRVGRRWEPILDALAESQLAILSTPFTLKAMLFHAVRHHDLPAVPQPTVRWLSGEQPSPRAMLVERTIGQLGVENRARWIRTRFEDIISPEQWLAFKDRLLLATQTLIHRGVTVVFIQMPSSGPYAAAEELLYPRSKYWDPVAEDACRRWCATGRFAALHFRDVPSIRSIDTPDWSHIAAEDRPRFTEAVGRAVDLATGGR